MIANIEYVRIGEGSKIDESSIVGYKPSRTVRDLHLAIGNNAVIRSGSIVYLGCRIGMNFESGHNILIREENSIGDNFKLWSNTVVDYGCKIGNNVKIHSNCYIAQLTTIEDDVFIAPGTIISNEKYPTGFFSIAKVKGPVIKRGAKIGINTSILSGVCIGSGSIIGAGSVVTKDVPDKSVAYGVPATIRKNVDDLDIS